MNVLLLEEVSFLTISNSETIFWERRVLMVEEQCTVPEIVNVHGAQSEMFNVRKRPCEDIVFLKMCNVQSEHSVVDDQ